MGLLDFAPSGAHAALAGTLPDLSGDWEKWEYLQRPWSLYQGSWYRYGRYGGVMSCGSHPKTCLYRRPPLLDGS